MRKVEKMLLPCVIRFNLSGDITYHPELLIHTTQQKPCSLNCRKIAVSKTSKQEFHEVNLFFILSFSKINAILIQG